MNGDFRDGYGRLPLSATLATRVSAASAYLDAATRARPNLVIEAETTVERLLFKRSRCVGVTTTRGERHARHVIVSGGAVHSPAILMRSGVGPADHLQSLGLVVVAPLQDVGANLQNHPTAYLASHVVRAARQSPLLRPQFNTALRLGSRDLTLLPVNKSSWHGLGAAVGGIGVTLLRPHSSGSVRLVSADPSVLPDVRFGMLADRRDFERMVEGLGLALELMQDPAVRPLRHELFAAGYSRVVRGFNRPGVVNVLLARALAALLDGPDGLRHALLKYGIASGDVDERRMRERAWLEKTIRTRAFATYHPVGTRTTREQRRAAAAGT
jgi:5-(hydroxymethyl)furfural/furfural oxidase